MALAFLLPVKMMAKASSSDNSTLFFMGTRIAIYNYATKAAGGYVAVDSFEYQKQNSSEN